MGGEPTYIGVAETADVNIAIIDTGIDYAREEISSATRTILFPSSVFSSCISTQSGWNYLGENDLNNVNEGNQDIMDRNGHGTYITKIITDELDAASVTYQILPLKVFNAEGKGTYWDVLCAFAYVKDINKNGGNISVVNASFGGSMPQEIFGVDAEGNKSLFAEMLDELNDLNTLVVTSAGNRGVDNELGTDRDFLSFFDAENLLSVGGYFDDGVRPVVSPIELASKSNWGATSIDIALAFNDYQIIFENPATAPQQDQVTLAGTSYSAAAMSALAAKKIKEAKDRGEIFAPKELKDLIFSNTSVLTGDFDDKIIDNKVILRE
ncbi:S8 family serine peptidase [Maribacter sp.]|nr:S8 family serine peptidase [Maribacter sp.]